MIVHLFVLDLMATVGVFLILTLSLNLDSGYCGICNFGKVLGMIGGAFVVAFFPGRIMMVLLGLEGDFVGNNAVVAAQINRALAANPLGSLALFFATLILAIGFGLALGYLSARPAARLTGAPLAVVLLVIGEAFRVIGHNYAPLAGGSLGVSVPDVFAWAIGYRFVIASVVLAIVALLVFFYINRLTNAPLGRMLRAVRDNENAARSLGIDIVGVKLKLMMVSTAIASLAGALYAFYSGVVASAAYTRVSWTFLPWAMMLVGGSANNIGIVSGVFSFVFIRKLIVMYKGTLAPFVPFDVMWLELIIFGIFIILIQLYRPRGIIPEKSTPTLNTHTIEKLRKTSLRKF